MSAGELSGPITQFQAHKLDKNGILRVLIALNGSLELKLPEAELGEILDVWWPHLEQELLKIGPAVTLPQSRPMQEQLDELLSLAREQIRRENLRLENARNKDERMEKMLALMDQSMAGAASNQRNFAQFQHGMSQIIAAIEKSGAGPIDPSEMDTLMLSALKGLQAPPIDLQAMRQVREDMGDLYQQQRKHAERLIKPEPPESEPNKE